MGTFDSVHHFYTYSAFMELMETLVANGQTSGIGNPEIFNFYTKLNFQRMQRWDKTAQLNEDLVNKLRSVQPQIWWVINEAWCGDAAQTLPVIDKLVATTGGNIQLRIIMRDENLPIMDKYLTNGGRSIPKLIAVDAQGNELFNWGPRPAPAQDMMVTWKANPNGISFNDKEKELHLWYAKDKGQTVQQELLSLI